ncbi:hypothetical protein KC19_4G123400 [Ceratodon purpureus]|uniref:Serine aminopeptidase S33 domain-containing protein n=1 Tax=Ceratodon purpureus TaxID=3225 RepID=A0A8T0IBH9_CERPU|nr:hypothetical protein KC19_4G123400 [Ceratodon purpureus]
MCCLCALEESFVSIKMDVIKHGSLLAHTSLARSENPLQKFAEINVMPPSGSLSRRNVWKHPFRLSTTTAKLSSSTDAPRKGKKPARREINKEPLRTEISPKPWRDSKEHDAQIVLLEKLAAEKALTETTPNGKHGGQRVWEELQKLTDRDTGTPRWLRYTSATKQEENAPLFLCLPSMCLWNQLLFRSSSLLFENPNALTRAQLADIISSGLSLSRHQEKLARLFEIRRLHVPVNDLSTNEDLIGLIEGTIREESSRRKGRPIYLLGEGYGALLALSVAARNPDVDLVLVLVDPATWCDERNILPPVVDVLDAAPGPVSSALPFLFSMSVGDPVTIAKAIVDPSLPQLEKLQQIMLALRDVLQVMATASVVWSRDVAPRKVNQLQMAARSAISEMENVKAQVLVLYSGKAQNENESKRLRERIPSAVGRGFRDRYGSLLLEDGIELASLIKASNMYRRGKSRNIVTDYVPPTEEEKEEFRKAHLDLFKQVFSPVYFHVKDDGSVKRGLPKLTKERPILLVCNHTFVGFDLGIIIGSFMESQNVMIRALAHPLVTTDQPGEVMAASSLPDLTRLLGAVPVSGSSLYKLLAAKETVFLLPGGMREAVKRKGESYKLIWPAKPEFVRTAIRHGAVIIPMAAVGGDEFIKILWDQQEILSLPIIGEQLHRLGNQMPRARQTNGGDDEGHMLGTVGIPTPPPRMYFTYQKPIYTHELSNYLNDNEVVEGLYQQVKSEIEAGMSYLLKKREEDPYQDFVPRMLYEKTWGKQAPTFKP